MAIPWSVWSLLNALGRDPRQAFFALPFTLNALLVFGLYNYVAGIALMFFAFAAAARLAHRYSIRSHVLLSTLLCLMLFTHAVPMLIALLGCSLLLNSRDARWTAQSQSALLPPIALALWWILTADAASPVTTVPDFSAGPSVDRALSELPRWLTCFLKSRRDDLLQLAWSLLFIAQFALIGPNNKHPGPSASFTLAAFARTRSPLLAWLLSSCLKRTSGLSVRSTVPRSSQPCSASFGCPHSPLLTRTALGALAAAVLVLVQTSLFVRAFQSVEREEGDIQQAIAAIPEGSRVELAADRFSRIVNIPIFTHYASYYQAEKGGVVAPSFVGQPTSPFVYRPAPRARGLDGFDYLLVRSAPTAATELANWPAAALCRRAVAGLPARASGQRERLKVANLALPHHLEYGKVSLLDDVDRGRRWLRS